MRQFELHPSIAEILAVRATDILSFDEKVVFNTTQNEFRDGAIGIQQEQTLAQELQKQYEAQQNEITRLHSLLEKALTK